MPPAVTATLPTNLLDQLHRARRRLADRPTQADADHAAAVVNRIATWARDHGLDPAAVLLAALADNQPRQRR
jgi:hypothetical protein